MRTLAAAFVVALGTLLLALPFALAKTYMTPDATNYLATANALAHGAGFVDPIQWHPYLRGGPPQPAWASLSPLISLVLAVPLALGASLTVTIATHTVFAACVAGATVVVARRCMSLPAAIACGVGLGWCTRFVQMSFMALTEPYAVLGVLLVLASSPGVARSHRGALLCAGATVFGWLGRANIPLLAIAVVVACVVEAKRARSWRQALLHERIARYVATYAAATVGAIVTLRVGHEAITGVAPYANYAAFFEMFEARDLELVDKRYVGGFAFAQEHFDRVRARWLLHARSIVEELALTGRTHFAGVCVLACLPAALLPGSSVMVRTAALGALGFLAQTALTYGGFEPRYVLPGVCCAWVGGAAVLDRLRRARWVLLAAVLVAFASQTAPAHGARALELAERVTTSLRARGHVGTVQQFRFGFDGELRALCKHMDPAWVAVAREAEALHFWCGNPTMRLPRDLGKKGAFKRFVGPRRVRWIVLPRHDDASTAVDHYARPRKAMRHVASTKRLALYEVRRTPRRVWRAPPSLSSLR